MEKTAFVTFDDLYEFRMMPFGLHVQRPVNISEIDAKDIVWIE